MTTVAINQALLLGLVVFFAPLSLVWAYALYDSVRGAIGRGGAGHDPDLLSWPVLLLLTGFFGAIAYLCLVLIPRLQRPRARVRLQAIRAF
jgi:TRAP-type mannitol/chloroaromatic compound transport system permease small subunit